MNKQAAEFLRKHQMHPDIINMPGSCAEFQKEMVCGLKGESSSLMMIPAYVSPESSVPQNTNAVVLDAGGTNLRVGLCRFTEDGAILDKVKVLPMPGTLSPLDKDTFLSELSQLVAPLLGEASHLGFCFSFPAEITPDMDGIVLGFNKEVVVNGSEGMHLCRELNSKLASGGSKPPKYALINDTVATLLGGYGATDPSTWDGYIGFILGTGTNCCYTEKTEHIEKLSGIEGNTMVVNVEAGGYGRFPIGDYDKVMDARSNNPGDHLYEKMVSGGYFGEIALETLKGAIQEGILSGKAPENIEMKDICAFLDDPAGATVLDTFYNGKEEKEFVYTLLDLLLDRAAKMVAVNLTAVLVQGDMGRSAISPACIVVEGSTFHKSRVYQEKISYYMRSLATESCGRHFRFRSFPDNNLKGSAVAVLLK